MIDFASLLKKSLADIKNTRPVIHHITNLVTINSCANAVSALGASPVMARAKEEAAQITSLSNALVLNLGTPDSDIFQAAKLSALCANKNGIPIIMDPVGIGASSFRKDNINSLLMKIRPSVIKGNLAEIKTLSGIKLEKNKVIDSQENINEDVFELAKSTAKKFNCIIAITGKEDIITDGKNLCKIKRGTEIFTCISGAGCITSSVIGTFLSVEKNPFLASSYGIYVMNICGEKAALEAKGSGSFYVNLIDNLFNINKINIAEEGIFFE